MREDNMGIEANKELVRREQEEFWGQGVESIAAQVFAPQVTEGNGRLVTPADLIAVTRMQRAAIPDLRVRVLDLLGEGDRVVARIEGTGTHLGDWQGIAATGRRFTISGMAMRQIADGRIVARWDNLDMLSFMQQIGAVPGG
jgi:predicted ester cyclase